MASMKFMLELSPFCVYAMPVWLYAQPESQNFVVHLFGDRKKPTSFDYMDGINQDILEEIFFDDGYGEGMQIVVENPTGEIGELSRFAGCTWDRFSDDMAWHALTPEDTRDLMENTSGKHVEWLKAFPSSPVLPSSLDELKRLVSKKRKVQPKKGKAAKKKKQGRK